MVRSLGKAMWRFLKTQNHDVIKVGLPRRTESRALKRDVNMHIRVHCGIDPCSQEAEVTKCPWTGKRINAAWAVSAVGDRSAFESTHASVRPSIHTFVPTLSPRVRLSIHPAVKCLLAHAVSGHPLRGAGLRAPSCPPPHCRQETDDEQAAAGQGSVRKKQEKPHPSKGSR